MQKSIAVILLAAVAGITLQHARADVVVMTQNLYVGAGTGDVLNAIASGNAAAISAATANYNALVAATNFPARSEALANEIAYAQPTLIGLQEAALYRTGPIGGPANTVSLDFVGTLLDSLAARGLHYAVAASVSLSDVETTILGPNGMDTRLTDRNVILARTDLTPGQLTISNPQQGLFVNSPVLPTPSGPLPLPNGWTSVDVQAGGMAFRFINAHLTTTGNGITEAFQAAQAAELLAGPGNTSLPQIFVGDYNSRANGTGLTYNNMVAAGLQDSWSQVHPGDPGFTWGHAADLLNPTNSTFTKRIDLVMSRGGPTATGAYIVGEEPADRTPGGLWPSDHAGVVVTLVPEPSTFVLTAVAAIGLAVARGRGNSARLLRPAVGQRQ